MTNYAASFVSLDVILPLRQEVIINGTDRDSPYFPGDESAETRHAAVLDQGTCIACATALPSLYEGEPAWQLRGMAVAPPFQRQGIGSLLLQFLETELPRIMPTIYIWCNAREKAAPFYLQAGYKIDSPLFFIEKVGMHYRMVKQLKKRE